MESALRSGVAHSRPVVSSFYEILESCLEWLGSGLSFVKRAIRCGYMWIDDAAAKESALGRSFCCKRSSLSVGLLSRILQF